MSPFPRKFNRIGLKLFAILSPGLVFIAAGLWLAGVQSGRLAGYTPVQASILSVDLSPHPIGGHTPLIRYGFNLDGNKHTATGVTPLRLGGSRQWAQTQTQRWPVNAQVRAYANPENPRQAFVIGRVYFLPYASVLLGVWGLSVPLMQLPRGGLLRPKPAVGKPDGHGWHPLRHDDPAKQLGVFESVGGGWLLLVTAVIAGHYGFVRQAGPRVDGYLDPLAHVVWLSALGGIALIWRGGTRVFAQNAAGRVRLTLTRPEAMLHDRVVLRAASDARADGQHAQVSLVCDRFDLFSRHRRFGLSQTLGQVPAERHQQLIFQLPRSRHPKAKPVLNRFTLPRDEWAFEIKVTLPDGRKITRRVPVPVADPAIKPTTLQDLAGGSRTAA